MSTVLSLVFPLWRSSLQRTKSHRCTKVASKPSCKPATVHLTHTTHVCVNSCVLQHRTDDTVSVKLQAGNPTRVSHQDLKSHQALNIHQSLWMPMPTFDGISERTSNVILCVLKGTNTTRSDTMISFSICLISNTSAHTSLAVEMITQAMRSKSKRIGASTTNGPE